MPRVVLHADALAPVNGRVVCRSDRHQQAAVVEADAHSMIGAEVLDLGDLAGPLPGTVGREPHRSGRIVTAPCASDQRLAVPTKPATNAVAGRSYIASGVPTCSRRPACITAIRSEVTMASAWSWVT
jgi:hypothetical protein